jgi:hypothetical protein
MVRKFMIAAAVTLGTLVAAGSLAPAQALVAWHRGWHAGCCWHGSWGWRGRPGWGWGYPAGWWGWGPGWGWWAGGPGHWVWVPGRGWVWR